MLLEQQNTTTTYQLGDGLCLRFATVDDVEPLAQFNGRIHGDDGFNPFVAQATREFTSPAHPYIGPDNVTLVEDSRTKQIVSSMCLIPQTWTYDGVPFEVGRPEVVGTDPAFRRRGLVRAQFELLHAASERAGHLAQAITGIPWYYRQFGYEYALDLSGGRWVYPELIAPPPADEVEAYRFRAMTIADIPLAMQLYELACARSLIACRRPGWWWQRMLTEVSPNSADYRHFVIVETPDGQPRGYVAYSLDFGGTEFPIPELNIIAGEPLRAVLPPLSRWLKAIAEPEMRQRGKPSFVLSFKVGAQHPAFEAAPDLFHKVRRPYGWYVRVTDVPRFLNDIAPVLEERLARSGLAGYSGAIAVTEYVRGFRIAIERGKISTEAYAPDEDVNAWFPPLTFLQLLFGRRSFEELDDAYPDCFASAQVEPVLKVLFPKRFSNVLPLG
jgi:hypothetical protein